MQKKTIIVVGAGQGLGNHVGMRSEARVKENLGAADVILTDEEYAKLTSALNKLEIHGTRNLHDMMKLGTVPLNIDR